MYDGSENLGGSTAVLGNGVSQSPGVVTVIDVSVLCLTVAILRFLAPRSPGQVPNSIERYHREFKPQMAGQDAKDEAAKKRIITHMNEDHRDSVRIK